MKSLLAIIISAIMLIVAAGTVFAAPEEAEGEIPAMEETADSEGESESDSGESESELADALTSLLGGWIVAEQETEGELPENVKAAYDKALEGYVGMDFTPIAYLGSQVVAGTNYQILCTGAPVVPEPETNLYVLVIYEDLEGNATITNVADFSLGEIEEDGLDDDDSDDVFEGPIAGGWTVPEEVKAIELDEESQEVFNKVTETLMGVEYTPAAVLGAKIINGTEAALLVYAKTVTLEPLNYFAVMFISENVTDGSVELMDIVPLDLADFNEPDLDDDFEDDIEDIVEDAVDIDD